MKGHEQNMRIRGRLIIAFLIMIIIPIILFAIVLGAIFSMEMSSFEGQYINDKNAVQLITNPMQILNKMTIEIFENVRQFSLSEPDRLQDIQYLQQWNQELEKRYSFIAVRKENNFIYIGDNTIFEKMERELPSYRSYGVDVDSGTYLGGQNPLLVKQHDFHFSDGKAGSVFIITAVDNFMPKLRVLAVQAVLSFILVICITASILTWWIYRGMVRPLNVLRKATYKLRDGDLEFCIVSSGEDEIGMLCKDFEEMRFRLKESIEARMAYELDMKELISNISHDLKTPLTAIEGYTEGIMDGVADTPEKMDKYLKTIHKKATDMNVLVDELAFYSKIDNNTVPYNFRNVDLDQYFNDCIQEVTLDLEVQKIELGYFNYTDEKLKVVADAEQLKRVINNIITNAAKYIGKKKGIINVRIKEEEQFVQIEFEDNGKGIPEKDLPFIFERFYRTDASRNSTKGGTGLGLAIAKKIIEEHGGSIWATSKEEVGTSIFFTLRKSSTSIKEEKIEEDEKLTGKEKKEKKKEKKEKKEKNTKYIIF